MKSWNAIGLGVTAIALASAAVAALLLISKAGLGSTRYRAEFSQAAQIQSGDDVSLAGVSVGKVLGSKLAGDHVVIDLQVRDDIHLGAGTRANIKLTTLLGSRYVELIPTLNGVLADHTIPLTQTGVPYDLQSALADATGTFEQVDAQDIGQSFTILSRQLDGLPAVLPKAIKNIEALSSIVSQRRDQIGVLLSGTAAITATLRQQQVGIGSLVSQGHDLFQEIVTRRASLTQSLQAVTKLVNVFGTIIVTDRADLDSLISSLNKVTAMLSQHDDLLRSILQLAPVAVRGITNAFGSSNALDINAPAGPLVDSWMCAISGRAKQFNAPEYFKDCK